MSDENELLEPLATEAGQQAIARAINNLSSLEYAVRAERAATTAIQKADEASNSADDASDYATEARNWAIKTDGYVDQETITVPPEQEGDDPTTETIDLYSARYYAALAQDIYNNLQFDTEPTEDSTNLLSSGAIYDALDLKADKSTTYTKTEVDTQISTAVSDLINSAPSALDTLEELANALGDDPNFATTIATQLGNKADKSDTYTKTEVDTALSGKADQSTTYTKTEVDTALGNVQSTLTFDNVPTANSDNPVKSSGIKTALDGKQDTLTFDSTPTANSNNPVTSGGVYTALQNVNIDIDNEITEDSDNPVTSAAIYEALQNFTPSGGGGAGNASGVTYDVLFQSSNSQGDVQSSFSLGNKRLSDYDELLLVFDFTRRGWGGGQSLFASTKDIIEVGYSRVLFVRQNSSDVYNVDISYNSTQNTIGIIYSDSTVGIKTVYGIKFSKNLSEQMYSNVLYENSNGWTSGSITLSDSLENYDFIEFLIRADSHVGSNEKYGSKVVSSTILKEKLGKKYEIDAWDERYIAFFITSNTSLTFDARIDLGIYKIIGYKMAKGGYSGIVSDARMTVKSGVYEHSSTLSQNGSFAQTITFDSPMPDNNYEVFVNHLFSGNYWADTFTTVYNKTTNGFTLECYQKSGTTQNKPKFNWIAIRPNSYTREGMVEDVLFSNANGVNSGTINLSGNISDYDLIQVFTTSDNTISGVHYQHDDCYLLTATDMLFTNQTDARVHYRNLGNSYILYNIENDNTMNIKSAQDIYITKITGIKFGRYVSGVAVDTTVTQNSNAVVTSGAVYDALQNYTPSGGGSSITVDSTITQGGTNPVEGGAIYTALGDKADQSTTYTKTEVDTALGNKQGTLTFDTAPTSGSSNPVTSGGVYTALASKGDVTTNTDQNITGTKTFVGSKKIAFKQSAANDKLGFTLFSNSNAERGYLEFNPTNTVDGVTGLMTLGNYATSAASLTQVGFRRYSNISGASGAYNLLMPMVADARTPFSLTTTYQNFYLPLGFTDGTTTVKTAKSGLVDLSPLLASLETRIAALEGN